MSRASITSNFKAAAFAQSTDKVYLVLLDINHESLDLPIRVVNNFEDIVVGAYTYTGYPFDLTLPAETDEAPPTVSLVIDNVDRRIIEAIRTLTGPPTITISVVISDTPTVIEAGPFIMTLKTVNYDAQTISGTIAFEDMLNEPYPGDFYDPANFPGLF